MSDDTEELNRLRRRVHHLENENGALERQIERHGQLLTAVTIAPGGQEQTPYYKVYVVNGTKHTVTIKVYDQ